MASSQSSSRSPRKRSRQRLHQPAAAVRNGPADRPPGTNILSLDPDLFSAISAYLPPADVVHLRQTSVQCRGSITTADVLDANRLMLSLLSLDFDLPTDCLCNLTALEDTYIAGGAAINAYTGKVGLHHRKSCDDSDIDVYTTLSSRPDVRRRVLGAGFTGDPVHERTAEASFATYCSIRDAARAADQPLESRSPYERLLVTSYWKMTGVDLLPIRKNLPWFSDVSATVASKIRVPTPVFKRIEIVATDKDPLCVVSNGFDYTVSQVALTGTSVSLLSRHTMEDLRNRTLRLTVGKKRDVYARINRAFCAAWVASDIAVAREQLRLINTNFETRVQKYTGKGYSPRLVLQWLRSFHQVTGHGLLCLFQTIEDWGAGNLPTALL
jgi:hypothetical protein